MPDVRDRPLLLGSLVVILAASGFGLLGPLARFAYEAGFAPLSFVAWRALFGFTVVAVVVAVLRATRGVPVVNPLRLGRADGLSLLVVGLAGLALNVAMFFAFDLATIALVLLAFYTYPALIAIVAVTLGHERLDAARWTALGLAVVGMVLVVAGGLGAAPGAVAVQPLGIVLGLVAAVCQTVFVTVSRGRFPTVPSEQAMGWVLLVSAVPCFALAAIVGNPLDVPFKSPDALRIVAVTGLVAAGIPSVLFLVGIRAIGGTRAGILMLFEPLVGVTLAALVLDEGLLPIQAAGGIAILVAAALLQRGGRPDEAPPVALEPAAVPTGERP
jgi:DME family drug/metabolite transporter